MRPKSNGGKVTLSPRHYTASSQVGRIRYFVTPDE